MPIVASFLLIAVTLVSAACCAQRWVIYPRYLVPRGEAPTLPEGTVRFEVPIDPDASPRVVASGTGPGADAGTDADAGSGSGTGASPAVEAWLLPAVGASADRPAPVVVFAHGNGESIDLWPDALEPYRTRGLHVLLVEYRGYGRSGGRPSETGITRDFVRALDFAAARPEVDGDRVVLHGRSLGGGVVCSMSRERRPSGIILESTFTSLAPLARRMWMPAFVLWDRYDNRDAMERFDGPVLLIHGRGDRVVPFEHAEELAAIGDRVRLVATEHGHNDLPPGHPRRWIAIDALLHEAGAAEPGPVPFSMLEELISTGKK